MKKLIAVFTLLLSQAAHAGIYTFSCSLNSSTKETVQVLIDSRDFENRQLQVVPAEVRILKGNQVVDVIPDARVVYRSLDWRVTIGGGPYWFLDIDLESLGRIEMSHSNKGNISAKTLNFFTSGWQRAKCTVRR